MNDRADESPPRRGARSAGIETRRLILRPPAPEDAAAIAALANNMNVASQTRRLPHPYSLKDADDWIALVSAGPDNGETGFLATRREDGDVIGAAGFIAMENGEAELGYWVGEPFWGRGFATEAAQAVVDHAFSRSAVARMIACCRVTNAASRRVLEKCGFQYTGAGMCDCGALASSFASLDFQLERSTWKSLKRWGRR
jgi:RimJ/RimL family protein N-acetyltransferase